MLVYNVDWRALTIHERRYPVTQLLQRARLRLWSLYSLRSLASCKCGLKG